MSRLPSRRTLAIVATVAVLAGGAVGGYLASGGSSARPPAAAAGPTPTLPPTPANLAPVPVSAPPVVAPAAPTVPHDYVAPATPTSFTLTGKQFTIKAHVCAMANIRPYDPPGEQHHTVCWVRSGFGVAPSSKQPATSYLFGHAWAEDDLEVLNKVSSLATKQFLHEKPHTVDGVSVYPVTRMNGYKLKLTTARGVLTYRVDSGYAVAKNQLGFIKSWLDPSVRDRVLLTTCAQLRGVDYDYNVILSASLYSSVATTSKA